MDLQDLIHDIRQRVVFGLADVRLWMAILVGAGLTWLLAVTGIDAWLNDLARLQNGTFSLAWSAFPMLAGMVVPALLPVAFALVGKRELATVTAGALLVALLVVSLLKGFTSRVHPEALEPTTSLLRSQTFQFGFLADGLSSLIEGWPSGHAATNGAAGLAIARCTSSSVLRFASLFWALWVALATVFGISGDVHWFSDTLAGGIIAWAISARLAVTRDRV